MFCNTVYIVFSEIKRGIVAGRQLKLDRDNSKPPQQGDHAWSGAGVINIRAAHKG